MSDRELVVNIKVKSDGSTDSVMRGIDSALQKLEKSGSRSNVGFREQTESIRELGRGYSGLMSRQEAMNKTVREQITAFQSAGKSIEDINGLIKETERQYDATTKQLGATVEEMERLGRSQEELAKTFSEISEAGDKLNASLQDGVITEAEYRFGLSELVKTAQSAVQTENELAAAMDGQRAKAAALGSELDTLAKKHEVLRKTESNYEEGGTSWSRGMMNVAKGPDRWKSGMDEMGSQRQQEDDRIKQAEELKKQAAEASEAFERAANKMVKSLGKGLHGITQLGRALTLFGVSGESDLSKVVEKMIKFEVVAQGALGIYKSIVALTGAWKALQAMIAAATVKQAIFNAVSAMGGGKAGAVGNVASSASRWGSMGKYAAGGAKAAGGIGAGTVAAGAAAAVGVGLAANSIYESVAGVQGGQNDAVANWQASTLGSMTQVDKDPKTGKDKWGILGWRKGVGMASRMFDNTFYGGDMASAAESGAKADKKQKERLEKRAQAARQSQYWAYDNRYTEENRQLADTESVRKAGSAVRMQSATAGAEFDALRATMSAARPAGMSKKDEAEFERKQQVASSRYRERAGESQSLIENQAQQAEIAKAIENAQREANAKAGPGASEAEQLNVAQRNLEGEQKLAELRQKSADLQRESDELHLKSMESTLRASEEELKVAEQRAEAAKKALISDADKITDTARGADRSNLSKGIENILAGTFEKMTLKQIEQTEGLQSTTQEEKDAIAQRKLELQRAKLKEGSPEQKLFDRAAEEAKKTKAEKEQAKKVVVENQGKIVVEMQANEANDAKLKADVEKVITDFVTKRDKVLLDAIHKLADQIAGTERDAKSIAEQSAGGR